MENPEGNEFPKSLLNGPPWEKREELGIFAALAETIRYGVMRPAQLFSIMRRETEFGSALLFVVGLQVFATVWRYALADVTGNPMPLIPPEIMDALGADFEIPRRMILLYPIWLILYHLVKGLSFHFALRLQGENRYPFSLMFRTLAYGAGTASVFMLVPVVGEIISMVLSLYLTYLGLRVVYGLQGGKFVGAALLASLLFLILMMGAMIVLAILAVPLLQLP